MDYPVQIANANLPTCLLGVGVGGSGGGGVEGITKISTLQRIPHAASKRKHNVSSALTIKTSY